MNGSPIQEACALIKQDMEADVAKYEGTLASGPAIAQMHGELAAAVSALAGLVAAIDRNLADDIGEAISAHMENAPHIYADGSTS